MGGVGICEVSGGRGCPSDQIFPKKTPSIAKTIQIKTAKIRQMKPETGVKQAEIRAKWRFAFVFEKCPKMHQ